MGQQFGNQALTSIVRNPCVTRKQLAEPEDDLQRLGSCLRRAEGLILEPEQLQRECDFHFRRGGLDADGLMRRVELRRLLWTFAHGLGSSRLTWEAIEASAVIGTIEPQVPVVTHGEFFRCVLKTVHLVAAELRERISEVEEALRREEHLRAEAAARARPTNPWAALAQQHSGAGGSSSSSRSSSSSCSSRAGDAKPAAGARRRSGSANSSASSSRRREMEVVASGAAPASAAGRGKGRGKGRVVSRAAASTQQVAAAAKASVPFPGAAGCAAAEQQDWRGAATVPPTPPVPTVAPRVGAPANVEAWGPFPRQAAARTGESAAAPVTPPSPLLAPAPAGGMGALLLPYPKPTASLGAGYGAAQLGEEELGCMAAQVSPPAAAPGPNGGTEAEVELLSSEDTWDPHVLSVSHGALLLREAQIEEPSWGQHFLLGGHRDEGDVFDLSILVSVLSGEGLLRSPAAALFPGLAARGPEALERMLLLSFAEDEVLFLSMASVEDCQRCFRAIQHEAGLLR